MPPTKKVKSAPMGAGALKGAGAPKGASVPKRVSAPKGARAPNSSSLSAPQTALLVAPVNWKTQREIKYISPQKLPLQ